MRVVTFNTNDGTDHLGVVVGQRVVHVAAAAKDSGYDPAPFADALTFLRVGQTALEAARHIGESAVAAGRPACLELESVRLRAPVPSPPKILCLAGNYAEHWRESGLAAPSKEGAAPQVFVKPATTIVGPEDPIRLPGEICTAVDYEGELVAVIGRAGRCIPTARALEHVAGYANFNDVSGRRLNIALERPDSPRTEFFDWLNGKWFDTFGPLGPYLVTADEVPDPQTLRVQTRVNGEQRQDGSTADMIYSVAETIEWISRFVTLEPGDLIATGTPSGVGSTTGRFLRAGDVVEVEVERLGVLRNPVGPPV